MFTFQFLNDKIHNYVLLTFTHEISQLRSSNVCSTEKYTNHSSVLLLRLVYFSLEQTLYVKKTHFPQKIYKLSKINQPGLYLQIPTENHHYDYLQVEIGDYTYTRKQSYKV